MFIMVCFQRNFLLIYVVLFSGQQPDGINMGVSGTNAFFCIGAFFCPNLKGGKIHRKAIKKKKNIYKRRGLNYGIYRFHRTCKKRG